LGWYRRIRHKLYPLKTVPNNILGFKTHSVFASAGAPTAAGSASSAGASAGTSAAAGSAALNLLCFMRKRNPNQQELKILDSRFNAHTNNCSFRKETNAKESIASEGYFLAFFTNKPQLFPVSPYSWPYYFRLL
jgi:hypothetical protein